MTADVAVVPTGVANLASIIAGLRRAGATPQIERQPDAVAAAPFAVLPGVGAFAAGMAELRDSGLAEVIAGRIQRDRPTLAVCLGMQLLGTASEESPGARGLECVAADATHFPTGVRSPQFGWNRVTPQPGCQLLHEGYAYFANSFRLTDAPAGWNVATAEHGGQFIAAMERGRVLACQFHPELSGAYGIDLIRRWLGGESC